MHIIACSYENIGPFTDSVRTVRFLPGASLIKAPIGSGKSFLFFDGLIFGLYKRSSRPMVSRHATHGQIQVLFSHAGAQWLIVRELKSTKAGNDSVTSKLFRVQNSREHISELFLDRYGQEIICLDVRISDFLLGDSLDEIAALGQKEIDTMILDLLPSREVTLSSCVLMQESDNVFEMTPAMRITVFKQLFDLLDMDHVRDHLADLRKTTQLRRQVLQEDMTVQQQFTSHYTQLRTVAKEISLCSLAHNQHIHKRLQQPFVVDLFQLDQQDMHIEGSLLHGYLPQLTTEVLVSLQDLLQADLLRQGQNQQLLVQQQTVAKSLVLLQQEQQKTNQRLTQLNELLSPTDTQELKRIQLTLHSLDDEVDALMNTLPIQQAATYGLVFTSIVQAQQCMHEEIARAKELQQELLRQEEKETVLTSQISQTQGQLQALDKQLTRLQDHHAHSESFRCDKIQADCPYVSVIRKVATSTLDEQISYITQQRVMIQETTLPDLLLRKQQVEEEKKNLALLIDEKKEMFLVLGWKDMEVLFRRANDLFTERKKWSTLLREIEQRLAASSSLREEQQQLLQHREQHILDIGRVEKESQALAEQIALHDASVLVSKVSSLKEGIHLIQRFEQSATQLAGLVDQFVERQQQIRELQEKESTLKDLIQIFQKELLIVVLQDFLPVLEEVINTYLQKIVSFSLRFELPKTMQEQIELAIWIEDEKGKRAVKSLSGGQKAVLRLCWILAVSTLFKQEYLLLDETINSLDQDAIGRVAELLDSFVKQREVTFYLVTHATQIQEMPFWQRVIELSPSG